MPILYSFSVFFNYRAKHTNHNSRFIPDQNGAPGPPGIHLKYFERYASYLPDSESGVSGVQHAWNFTYFEDQKLILDNPVKYKMTLFWADSRAADNSKFYKSPNRVNTILKLHVFAIRTQRWSPLPQIHVQSKWHSRLPL